MQFDLIGGNFLEAPCNRIVYASRKVRCVQIAVKSLIERSKVQLGIEEWFAFWIIIAADAFSLYTILIFLGVTVFNFFIFFTLLETDQFRHWLTVDL